MFQGKVISCVFERLGHIEIIFRKLKKLQYACGTELYRQGLLPTNRLSDMAMSLTLKDLKSIKAVKTKL